ncbi:alpha/beta fold hydrolase [Burkholderia plantarii]|uniref:alpha/beta fold hydrolase n=1 Tax=Burkholderia plantarii TaxID=41899 RepID=UPI0006D8BCD8|nr:alpha/beta hydrolase [Burkholderia plantarii]ALK32407.1 alpha/beta hydrolase fold protein [Burkholderia plantarii]GLZ18954.1 alpha/beta hydrolase [Burkholderia plantarii]
MHDHPSHAGPTDGAPDLGARLPAFPARRIDVAPARAVGYREAGAPPAAGPHAGRLPIVLLHGIGSGAASWVQQLDTLGAARRVLAWDTPGYGESSPVAPASPQAGDYAAVLADWLDALGVARCVLVGHSLGAIVAGRFAATHGARVAGLLLLSPAAGYGAASEAVRAQKRDARLAMLAELGPQGLAERRSANMLSPSASEPARQWVRWNMARVVPAGYAQATHLLANADLAADLAGRRGPVMVAVGEHDGITPPEACARLARAAGVPLQLIPNAGHAGYIEAPAACDALIDAFARRCETPDPEASA